MMSPRNRPSSPAERLRPRPARQSSSLARDGGRPAFARRIARARLVFLLGARPLGDWIALTPGVVVALSLLAAAAAGMPGTV